MGRGSHSLAHMDFRPASFKVHVVHARPHFPALPGAPTQHRTPLPERTPILQSTSSSGLPVVRSLESCWASRSQFPERKYESVFLRTTIENLSLGSGFAFHSWQAPHAREKCIAEAK